MTATERSNSAIRGPRHALVVFLSAIAVVSVSELVVRMATQNRLWGYTRIQGATHLYENGPSCV